MFDRVVGRGNAELHTHAIIAHGLPITAMEELRLGNGNLFSLAFRDRNNSLGRVKRLFAIEPAKRLRGNALLFVAISTLASYVLLTAMLWSSAAVASSQRNLANETNSESNYDWAFNVYPSADGAAPNRRVVCFSKQSWMPMHLKKHIFLERVEK